MKVLFDNGTPNPLAGKLVGHDITFARRVGWAELANGELIQKAQDSGFEVLLSTDKSSRHSRKRQLATR